MSKRNFERLIFISFIFILLLIAVYAVKKEKTTCPELDCEVKVVEKQEKPKVVEQKKVEVPTSKVHHADIENFNVAPPELTIEQGDTIVFTNGEAILVHKLYEAKGYFLGPRMEPGDSYNVTFNETGEFVVFSVMGKDKGTRLDVEVI